MRPSPIPLDLPLPIPSLPPPPAPSFIPFLPEISPSRPVLDFINWKVALIALGILCGIGLIYWLVEEEGNPPPYPELLSASGYGNDLVATTPGGQKKNLCGNMLPDQTPDPYSPRGTITKEVFMLEFLNNYQEWLVQRSEYSLRLCEPTPENGRIILVVKAIAKPFFLLLASIPLLPYIGWKKLFDRPQPIDLDPVQPSFDPTRDTRTQYTGVTQGMTDVEVLEANSKGEFPSEYGDLENTPDTPLHPPAHSASLVSQALRWLFGNPHQPQTPPHPLGTSTPLRPSIHDLSNPGSATPKDLSWSSSVESMNPEDSVTDAAKTAAVTPGTPPLK